MISRSLPGILSTMTILLIVMIRDLGIHDQGNKVFHDVFALTNIFYLDNKKNLSLICVVMDCPMPIERRA